MHSDKNEEEFYDLIKNTVREIVMSIVKKPEDIPFLTDKTVLMINSFVEKIVNTEREMNKKDFVEMDNIVTENLLTISGKVEYFTPDEDFIRMTVLKIAFMSLKIIDIVNNEQDEQSRRN
jgi:hypothetical protein